MTKFQLPLFSFLVGAGQKINGRQDRAANKIYH
jgi:hypothetical protein